MCPQVHIVGGRGALGGSLLMTFSFSQQPRVTIGSVLWLCEMRGDMGHHHQMRGVSERERLVAASGSPEARLTLVRRLTEAGHHRRVYFLSRV